MQFHHETIVLKKENKQLHKQFLALQSEIDALQNENLHLEAQNRQLTERIKALEAALKAQAEAKAAKKPDFKLHYDVERNQPGPDNETPSEYEARQAAKRKRPQAGRIPSELKTADIV